ncbi:TonB-dependent receptor [Paraglaciecola chathamensis]|uniref:TonB-dependent receptor n=1 Tax=Paraglaciecola chathamensis TaxID=368405 RepID=A0ABS0WJ67_9ALTE|nr:TonB-dependent receptor [Paraglaciecola chathamensis]MBJ2138521.1 TonB-dependent receptor [Paraglaciecola chathamensis]
MIKIPAISRLMFISAYSISACSLASQDASQQVESMNILGTRLAINNHSQLSQFATKASINLPAQLNQIPGLQVNPNAGPGSVNELFLQGADSNYTLVMLNGIPLNDGTNSRGGAANISLLNPFLVDRIDVVQGAQSSLYGSQGLAGAVNFVALPDATEFEGQAPHKIRLGADSRSGFMLGAQAQFERLSIKLASERAPEMYPQSELKTNTALIVASPELSSGELTLTLLASNGDSQGYAPDSGGEQYAETTALEKSEHDNVSVAGNYQNTFDDTQIWLQGIYIDKQHDVDSSSVAPGVRDPAGLPASFNANKLRQVRLSGHVQHHFEHSRWLMGIDYVDETGESQGELDFNVFSVPTDFNIERDYFAYFAEGQINLTTDLSATVAARVDDTEQDSVFSPSVDVAWQVDNQHRISVNWGKGFKLPSFYALGHPLIGNEALKSERSETRQLRFERRDSLGFWSINLFDNSFENLVDFEPGPPPQLVNRAQSDTSGVTLGFASHISTSDFRWAANYTYLDAKADGQVLLGRAQHSAHFSLSKEFVQNGITLNATLDYKGRVFASSIPTAQIEIGNGTNLGLDAAVVLTQGYTLRVGLQNTLQQDLEFSVGNRHAGRYAWAMLDVEFN